MVILWDYFQGGGMFKKKKTCKIEGLHPNYVANIMLNMFLSDLKEQLLKRIFQYDKMSSISKGILPIFCLYT